MDDTTFTSFKMPSRERVDVRAGVERRRRWAREDKLRIVRDSLEPNAVISDVALRHEVSASLIYAWRKQALAGLLARRLSCRSDHCGGGRGTAGDRGHLKHLPRLGPSTSRRTMPRLAASSRSRCRVVSRCAYLPTSSRARCGVCWLHWVRAARLVARRGDRPPTGPDHRRRR